MTGGSAPSPPPPPTPKPAPIPPPAPTVVETDPELKLKRDEAAVTEKVKIQSRRGYGRTIATSPLGVLGSAPINRPELKGSLGGNM